MVAKSMMIGQLGRQAGIKVTTIRFYEAIGLLPAPPRTASGRRTYSASHIQRLMFIRNGRRLGFSIEEIRSLVDLAESSSQDCSVAAKIAARHLAEVEDRLAQLALLRDELAVLAESCTNARIADCGIIQAIAGS